MPTTMARALVVVRQRGSSSWWGCGGIGGEGNRRASG
jgi:hypothetical protein